MNKRWIRVGGDEKCPLTCPRQTCPRQTCPRQDSNLTSTCGAPGPVTCDFCASSWDFSTLTHPAVCDIAGHMVLLMLCESCAEKRTNGEEEGQAARLWPD